MRRRQCGHAARPWAILRRRHLRPVLFLSLSSLVLALFLLPTIVDDDQDSPGVRGDAREWGPLTWGSRPIEGGGLPMPRAHGNLTGVFGIPTEEEPDALLRRPNPRRGPHATSADDAHVTVVIATFATRVSNITCTAVASAYLSGLPIVVMGYEENFTSLLDKPQMALDGFRKAGLRPHDVVLLLDDDILFYDGDDLLSLIDRFIAYSPESAAEVDARVIRDAKEPAMAPMILSAEANCYWPHALHGNRHDACYGHYLRLAQRGYGAYYRRVYPAAAEDDGGGDAARASRAAYPGERGLTTAHLNSGTVLSRMWAFADYNAAVRAYAQVNPPFDFHGKPLEHYFDDQSIATALYLDLLHWEARTDRLSPHAQRRETPQPRSPYGLVAGAMALDYDVHLSAVAFIGARQGQFLDERFWRRESAALVPARTRTWRSLAAEAVHRARVPPLQARPPALELAEMQCDVDDFLHRNAGSGGVGGLAVDLDDPSACAALRKPPARVRPSFYLTRPLPRSRAPGVTSIPVARPLLAVYTRTRPDAGRTHVAFPPLVHYAGGMAGKGKGFSLWRWLYAAPWYIPVSWEPTGAAGEDTTTGRGRLRAFLHLMPIELWSTSHRVRRTFGDVCGRRLHWL